MAKQQYKYIDLYNILIILSCLFIGSYGYVYSSQINLSRQLYTIKSSSRQYLSPDKSNNLSNPTSKILFEGSELFGKISSIFNRNSEDNNIKKSKNMNSNGRISIERMKNQLNDQYLKLFWVTGKLHISKYIFLIYIKCQ